MISDILIFLRNNLNSYLKTGTGLVTDISSEDKVVFIDGDKTDPIVFKTNAVSVLLINLEEEKILRSADPYLAVLPDGTQKVQPVIRMNLYVLFVARFTKYDEGLHYLSLIIQYFQNKRVFDHAKAPDLPEKFDQLVLEIITLPLNEQNELWNALRTAYQPSVLYKVKMVTFKDKDAMKARETIERVIKL
ncbi:MAG: DUF4255 domain-containing protein [Calditrichaeota bacterium]|nr:MAG: DUF4255 domain-containing protein [Calditrichota bacterium]